MDSGSKRMIHKHGRRFASVRLKRWQQSELAYMLELQAACGPQ